MMTRNNLERIVYPLLGVVIVLALWQLTCVFWKMPEAVLPTPMNVARAIAKYWPALVSEGWVTLKATLYGFALALLLGIPIAVAVSLSSWVNLMFYPLLVATSSG